MKSFGRTTFILVGLAAVAVLIGCGGTGNNNEGRIAFQTAAMSPDDILMMNGNGTDIQTVISDAKNPSLRRDGRVIAFARGTDIYTVRTDGTSLFKVTNHGVGVEALSPAFSSGGDRIAYALKATAPGSIPDIRIVNSDGTGDALLLANADKPSWSPDSTMIAFARGSDIYTIHPDGTNLVNQTNNGVGVTARSPSFGPSNTELAYAEEVVVPSPVSSIRLLNLVNGDKTNVISNGSQPSYRPDGNRIAFVRTGDIYSINRSGTDLVQLTSSVGDDSHPSWANKP